MRSLLAFVAPLASALTLTAVTPNPFVSTGPYNVTFQGTAADPYVDQTFTPFPLLTVSRFFSLELNNVIFNSNLAIANNIDPTSGSYAGTLGVVPVGYVCKLLCLLRF